MCVTFQLCASCFYFKLYQCWCRYTWCMRKLFLSYASGVSIKSVMWVTCVKYVGYIPHVRQLCASCVLVWMVCHIGIVYLSCHLRFSCTVRHVRQICPSFECLVYITITKITTAFGNLCFFLCSGKVSIRKSGVMTIACSPFAERGCQYTAPCNFLIACHYTWFSIVKQMYEG